MDTGHVTMKVAPLESAALGDQFGTTFNLIQCPERILELVPELFFVQTTTDSSEVCLYSPISPN